MLVKLGPARKVVEGEEDEALGDATIRYVCCTNLLLT
jgi:hypothetical protein